MGDGDWHGLVRERQGALPACLTGVASPCRVSDRGRTKSTQGQYSRQLVGVGVETYGVDC